MAIRWLTAFLDRPAAAFDPAIAFWSVATGSSLSPARGDRSQYATLIPGDGDPYLRVQRVDAGPGGSHLDIHVGDIHSFALRAVAAGGEQLQWHRDVVVLRSPAGLPWCAVPSHGEAVRPQPRPLDNGGSLHLVDQVCIDVPNDRFDDECAFWSRVTGWEQQRSSVRPEFRYLLRPQGLPLRLLLQRRHDANGPARPDFDTVIAKVLVNEARREVFVTTQVG